MNIKFAPDLFLEVVELERFKQSLDEKGFRKNIIENSHSFGLVKNLTNDTTFQNGRVLRDLDAEGEKTIKIPFIAGVDRYGQFIVRDEVRSFPVPSDGSWYWVKVFHQYSNEEKGLFSIDVNGNLVGDTDAELTKIFRGQPNFPTKVKFVNSSNNILEYDVLEIIDDQNAILSHPALAQTGASNFAAEDDLKIKIWGTFTPGILPPPQDRYPFQYDFCTIQLVEEETENTRPLSVNGVEFFLARIKVDGGDVIVQDKRIQIWETKGAQKVLDITRAVNPLIGIESIKWNNILSPSEKNIVELAWGMRTQNWSVNTSQNILTFEGSATGGKFKTVTNFTNGDFNGWRLYSANGFHSKVLSSVKQGSAINLILDVLDVDNFSDDGGETFRNEGEDADWLIVVPDADSINIKFTPNPEDEQPTYEQHFSFPINTLIGRCEVLVYKNPSCLYNVQSQLQSFKEFTGWIPIPGDGLNGYYKEESFDDSGNLKENIGDRVKQTYTSDPELGFIELILSPLAYSRFRIKVDKGDIIGVRELVTFSENVYELKVGESKNYQHIVGSISLTNDVYFTLQKTDAVEGNEFRIHFECDEIFLNTKKIFIAQEGTSPGSPVIIKTITQGDVYAMMNQEKGIVIDCIYDGVNWFCYQNYDLGTSNEIKTIDGVVTELFDGLGMGRVIGLYGYALCDGRNTTPNLKDRFIIGISDTLGVGDMGGNKETTLELKNIPPHEHEVNSARNTGSSHSGNELSNSDNGTERRIKTTTAGGNDNDVTVPFSNLPPYMALIYCKKLY